MLYLPFFDREFFVTSDNNFALYPQSFVKDLTRIFHNSLKIKDLLTKRTFEFKIFHCSPTENNYSILGYNF